MSSNSHVFEKLIGRENYDVWAKSAQSFMVIKGFWKIDKTINSSSKAEEIDLNKKALAELHFLVNSRCFSLLKHATDLKSAWNELKKAFADGGSGRKTALLIHFVNIKYENCESMQDYVANIFEYWDKVTAVGFNIEDNVVASLLLGGLPEYCAPMVLGIENSVKNLTADYIRNLLLQEKFFDKKISESGSALAVKIKTKKEAKQKFNKKEVKCYVCEKNHFARYCPNRRGIKSEKVLLTSFLVDEFKSGWYIDSGASTHTTNDKSILANLREAEKKK